jgi:hypothetical protein
LQVIKTDAPRKVIFGEYSTIVLYDTSVLFAGMDQFSSSRDGKTIESPEERRRRVLVKNFVRKSSDLRSCWEVVLDALLDVL